jgi:D-alanyl-D-alanine carboxypeptidase (penicillin-binding protein 5/6)/beta-lactamase class A
MRGHFSSVILVLLGSVALALAGDKDLESRIAPLAKAHKGKTAVAVKNLTTGDSFYLNADEVMPTASLIKLPIMIETYQQASENKVRMKDLLTLHDSDKVPGSGVLTEHFSDGATFPLRDCVRLMIVFSDNTATNMVLDKIGIDSTNKRFTDWGFKETKVNAKVYRGTTTSVDLERTNKYGLGSTTAREMAEIIEKLHAGKFVGPEATKDMIEHLKKCDDTDKMPRFLPPRTVVAHKTGSVNDARTDGGLIYVPGGPVVVVVMTAENQDKTWTADNAGNVFCARVAKEVFEHFTAKPEDREVIPGQTTLPRR